MHTTTYTMIVGAIVFLCVSPLQKNIVPIMDIPLLAWFSILFMAIGTSVLGYLWWNNGVSQIGAAKTSLFFNLVPVVTMIVSFLNGANITLAQVLGMILVISGVLLSSGFFILRAKKESINL